MDRQHNLGSIHRSEYDLQHDIQRSDHKFHSHKGFYSVDWYKLGYSGTQNLKHILVYSMEVGQ